VENGNIFSIFFVLLLLVLLPPPKEMEGPSEKERGKYRSEREREQVLP